MPRQYAGVVPRRQPGSGPRSGKWIGALPGKGPGTIVAGVISKGTAWACLVCGWILTAAAAGAADSVPSGVREFLQNHCADCHDAEAPKGGLDLTSLAWDPASAASRARWVLALDRVLAGEMPPPKRERPPPAERAAFATSLSNVLVRADQAAVAAEGRSTFRRMNRFEYEQAVRDLLQAPWLQIRESLPEDGTLQRFNKIGDALDVSHVQMARYLTAADTALRQGIASQPDRPAARPTRYHTRDQRSYVGPMKFTQFNTYPERATFPVLGFEGQPAVRSGAQPITVGTNDPATRELEGMGVVAGSYEPLEPKFDGFRAPAPGRYRLRFVGHTVWVRAVQSNQWFIPDLDAIGPGRRTEPVTVYSETPPRQLRRLGSFDLTPQPEAHELTAWLLAGETIRVDPARLFRSRPGKGRMQNPLAEKDGQPAAVFRWLEVEGPIHDEWPPAGHRLLFDTLPLKPAGRGVEVVSANPRGDAERLLGRFLAAAYRRTNVLSEVPRFLPVVEQAMASGSSFTDAMIAGYTAVLCSPGFVCVEEAPGRLDSLALATRLSLFLWNSIPDAELRETAAAGRLQDPAVLRAQAERLLEDPKSRRFVDAFLDYWLDLRRMDATAPDATLYPDYYLDDLLTESALEETRAFVAELLRDDLPVRNLVASDFAMVNERLARHYGLPPFEGVELRRVSLPAGSPRGGLLTQASVLKVTANGTTTSPVLRGAWVMERILANPLPPPPPGVGAVEPDTRGATTIREQLEKHRREASCAVCHVRMDPPGFALESFDVLGGWREQYRAQGPGKPEPGIGKGGHPFEFHLGPKVDASGELPDGRRFSDVREFKALLLADERPIARNLVRQLAVYGTGAPIRFSDRAAIEEILDRSQARGYGIRTLILELIQSPLFQFK